MRAPVMRGLAAAALLALAGCEMPVPAEAPPPAPPDAAAEPAAHAPSQRSRDMALMLDRVQASLRARGLLRTDGGGPDTPFTARMLAQNFVRIALFDEYTAVGSMLVARATPSRLRRWEEPVRMHLIFGDSVPDATRAKDRRDIAAFTARLARATGHPVGVTTRPAAANFHILVLDEDERRAAAPLLRTLLPGIDALTLRTITGMDPAIFCLVFAFSTGGDNVYTDAVAVIRAEHPGLMRLACYHEELAQGLGLANDSPGARPSIFNDDEEFALLTRHDELLLRMLYDPRLQPGMTEAQARPIAEAIARELIGGKS